ncbi:hypothetical protein GIB67_031866 [Kingdonia uniflora]|uniref:Rubisco LSMT substrate-binding domain-containing protein n=1 Tax=Kingdonia uniflora TaxID=39325 RepID=A0A7J7L4Q7_9MAGN|nr:hypothetical protein GIB67_031866 [Kingdonia uniflora]
MLTGGLAFGFLVLNQPLLVEAFHTFPGLSKPHSTVHNDLRARIFSKYSNLFPEEVKSWWDIFYIGFVELAPLLFRINYLNKLPFPISKVGTVTVRFGILLITLCYKKSNYHNIISTLHMYLFSGFQYGDFQMVVRHSFLTLSSIAIIDERVALVPWADMLNHSCEVETFLDYDKSSQAFVFTTDRPYQPGEQEKLEVLKKHGLSASERFPIQIPSWPVELMAYAYLVVSPPTMARQFEESSGLIGLDVASPSQINLKLFLKQLAVNLCTSEQIILFRTQYILRRRLRDMKSGELRGLSIFNGFFRFFE